MYVLEDSDGTFYPADRCTFRTVYDTDLTNYVVTTNPRATFYGTTTTIPLSNNSSERPRLGYIGKSGRFVPMTE